MTDDTFYETIKDTEFVINPEDRGFIFNIASKSLINIKIRVQISYTISFPDRNSWKPIYYYNPFTEIPCTEQPKASLLKGLYSQGSNNLSLSLTCSQSYEILLVIGIDEIALSGDYDFFKLQPENVTLQQESNYILKYEILPTNMIMDIYNNRIGNQITYYDYDIANQVNYPLIKDNSYKTLMNSIRRMMINKLSLLDKASQLHLQQSNRNSTIFDTTVTFALSNMKQNTKYSLDVTVKI